MPPGVGNPNPGKSGGAKSPGGGGGGASRALGLGGGGGRAGRSAGAGTFGGRSIFGPGPGAIKPGGGRRKPRFLKDFDEESLAQLTAEQLAWLTAGNSI